MWRDISIDFDMKADGDIMEMEGSDAIENSIRNIWKTLQGSRRMLFPFASPSWGVLFEQMDDATSRDLGRLLLKSIEKWEDRISVENLHIVADEDNGRYDVQLSYKIISEGDIIYVYTDVITAV